MIRKPINRSVICVLFLALGMSAAYAQDNVLTPEIAVGLKRVTDVAMVAYALSVPRGPDDEPGGSYSEIWLVPAAGGEARRFTAPKVNSSAPAWSPDGSMVAFLSKRTDQHEQTQIYLIAPAGGEARILTRHETGVSAFEWSPDGGQIAFTARDPKTDETTEAEKEGRDWVIADADDRHLRLWTVDVESGEERAVYDKPLTTSNFAWTPDSGTIIFEAASTPRIDDGYMYQKIYRTTIGDGATPAVLCPTVGKLGSLAVAPDGSLLAFQGATSLNDPLDQSLFIVPLDGSEPRNLTEGLEASVAQVAFAPDGRVATLLNMGTGTVMGMFEPVSGQSSQSRVRNAAFSRFSLSRETSRIAFIASGATNESEVYVVREDGSLVRLTNHNPILDDLELGFQETIEWKGANDWRIEGVLVYPVGYQPGQRCPLVVNPHGGPEGVSQEGFNVFAQLLAARGYLVLQPNYRGSGGRGVAFSKGDHNDLGGTEYEDIIKGIDAVVMRGLADPDRVGSAGWSYGGYLSAYAATHFSHRYKAAVMGAGISNWISFAGTTDIPHEMQIVHWNQWWPDDPRMQWERSPLSAIDQASTPTLILHGMADDRVHPEQAMQMYQALKLKGVPTQLVLYPRAEHGVSERAHRLDLLQRQLDWFDTYLK